MMPVAKKRLACSLLAILAIGVAFFIWQGRDRAGSVSASDVGSAELSDEAAGADWLSHGRTWSEQRFSPLDQIQTSNIDRLGLAFFADIDTPGEIEATPLVANGIIYTTGTFGVVFAIDGRNGDILWRYDPGAQARNAEHPAWGRNRGVAMWQGKIYVGVADGRLIAIDALSGELVWEVQTFDRSMPYSITGAPRVFDGKVVIGQGGGDRGTRGFASAYDAQSGELAWRFWVVPGNPADGFESDAMAVAAETWNGEWWKYGGGGNPWNAFAYDPELRLVYIGTGNGGPWNRQARSPGGGDNLYLSSIVAVNVDSGEYVWHYQTTPGDQWDYTAVQDIVLATLDIAGEPREVLMQAPKNGFFYILDRATGELLSAEKYVPANWAESVDLTTGRPIENPAVRGGSGPVEMWPNWVGGHSWQPMSYNPMLETVFIPFVESSQVYGDAPNLSDWVFDRGLGIDNSTQVMTSPELVGGLMAWDPVHQRVLWRRELATGLAGGTMTTASGLVFQGTGSGHLVAYDGQTGDELWRAPAHNPVLGGPVSYSIGGVQYIAVMAGTGGAVANLAAFDLERFGWRYGEEKRLLVFALDGDAQLPPHSQPQESASPPQMGPTGDQLIDRGFGLYHTHCVECHGPAAVGNGSYPDLRRSERLEHLEAILLQNAMAGMGMPGFPERLDTEDVAAITAYLQSRKLP